MKRPDVSGAATAHMRVRQSRFPVSLFWLLLISICLTAGVQMGLLLLMDRLAWSPIVQAHIALLYWVLVALGLTLMIRRTTRKYYEEPIQKIGEAVGQVAQGDFSVYIPPLHTEDKQDYLDLLILDLNTMIESLGSIETLKTDFFSNVSHEIKTPLAVIQNSAELLAKGDLTEAHREQTDIIRRQSRRLSELITNILKLNRLEKQVIVPAMERYDLCQQLADCLLLFEDRWEEKNLDITVDIEDSVAVSADRSLMDLVWTNILSNAVKFTELGGSITLTQTPDERGTVVSITDTGCGMDEETVRHIYEKFYQGDSSHATEGNGLGMALTYRILQLHHFEIGIDSEPGKGSTFTVIIPKEDGEA